jgi:single-strand DNA-binding protein
MRSYNQITLLGHVGSVDNQRKTAGGTRVVNISLATNPWPKTDKRTGEQIEQPAEWHRLVLWDRLAEIATKYIKKGDTLFITGRLRYSKYTPNDSTREVIVAEIHVREMSMVGDGIRAKDAAPALAAAGASPFEGADDDLPF